MGLWTIFVGVEKSINKVRGKINTWLRGESILKQQIFLVV